VGQPPEVEGGKPDRRVFFGEGWVLLLGMLVFGTVGGYFLIGAMPSGWRGLARLAVMIVVVLLVGGLVGPGISRALRRR